MLTETLLTYIDGRNTLLKLDTYNPQLPGADGQRQISDKKIATAVAARRDREILERQLFEWVDKDGTKYIGNSDYGYHNSLADIRALEGYVLDREKPKASGKEYRQPSGKYPEPVRFTAHGAQKLKSAGAIADRDYKATHTPYMLTLTLPGSSERAYAQLAKSSSYLLNRILIVLRRLIDKPLYMGVWEFQRRGALHLHMAVWIPHGVCTHTVGKKLKDAWIDSLRTVQKHSGVDMFYNEVKGYYPKPKDYQNDWQKITKSVCNYFAKYASKNQRNQNNSISIADIDENGNYIADIRNPHRWWFLASAFHKILDRNEGKIGIVANSKEEWDKFHEDCKALFESFNPTIETSHEFEVTDRNCEKNVICKGTQIDYYFPVDKIDEVRAALASLFLSHIVATPPVRVQYSGCPFALSNGTDALESLDFSMADIRNQGKILSKLT